jgi:hypothetical protein
MFSQSVPATQKSISEKRVTNSPKIRDTTNSTAIALCEINTTNKAKISDNQEALQFLREYQNSRFVKLRPVDE